MKKKLFSVFLVIFVLLISFAIVSATPPQCWRCNEGDQCELAYSGHTICAQNPGPYTWCLEFGWTCPL
jgi:hypothetical protein